MGIWWSIGFIVAALVVLIVAGLLLGILYQARRIRRLAQAAEGVVVEIEANTRAAWALGRTNKVAGALSESAKSSEASAAAINAALAGDADRESAA